MGSAGAACGKPCGPTQTCLPCSWLLSPGSEDGASGGSSGPQRRMWPWRDGVEAGVGGHADRVLWPEPGWTGSRISGTGTRRCHRLRGPERRGKVASRLPAPAGFLAVWAPPRRAWHVFPARRVPATVRGPRLGVIRRGPRPASGEHGFADKGRKRLGRVNTDGGGRRLGAVRGP